MGIHKYDTCLPFNGMWTSEWWDLGSKHVRIRKHSAGQQAKAKEEASFVSLF